MLFWSGLHPMPDFIVIWGNYGDYIETDSVTGVKKYYGYNAFSSFVDALTVASDLTINNANFASGITIDVESNIANDVIPAGDGSLNLEFKGAILIVGDHTVTIKGDRYLRLGAATNTTSFVFNPDFVFDYRQVGTVNTGRGPWFSSPSLRSQCAFLPFSSQTHFVGLCSERGDAHLPSQ